MLFHGWRWYILETPGIQPDASNGVSWSQTFTGRLGNLMFEYATLVGACVRHGLQPETCAGFSMGDLNKHNVMLPTKTFHDLFEIPMVSCPTNASMTYREHADSIHAIKYDAHLLERPPGTSFQGYLQSYKYFHHARSDIQTLYIAFLTMLFCERRNSLLTLAGYPKAALTVKSRAFPFDEETRLEWLIRVSTTTGA